MTETPKKRRPRRTTKAAAKPAPKKEEVTIIEAPPIGDHEADLDIIAPPTTPGSTLTKVVPPAPKPPAGKTSAKIPRKR